MKIKFTITIFYESPIGYKRYLKATNAEETPLGGLQFTDSDGDEFTISHRIPWCVIQEKGEQS